MSTHGVSLAGGPAGRRTPASCSMRWSRRSTTGGLWVAAVSSITATEAANLDSIGRRNEDIRFCEPSVKRFGRGLPAEGFSWPRVEGRGNSAERLGAVHAQVRALREVLAQQPIGVLVGAALPRALRIAEVFLDARIDL